MIFIFVIDTVIHYTVSNSLIHKPNLCIELLITTIKTMFH